MEVPEEKSENKKEKSGDLVRNPHKSNMFNLVSLWRKEEIKTSIEYWEKNKDKEGIKLESGTIDTNFPTEEPIEQESITEIRRQHKREHKKENPKFNLDQISKVLKYEGNFKEEEGNIVNITNPFEISVDNEIEAIEEVSNETFTTINEDKELVKQNHSLFGCPQTTILREGRIFKLIFKIMIDISFSEKELEETEEKKVKQWNISSISFQKRDDSDNQRKEIFNASQMISSPDFDKTNTKKLNLSKLEISGEICEKKIIWI